MNHTLTMLASYGGQIISTSNRLYILQKKSLRFVNFKECNAHFENVIRGI